MKKPTTIAMTFRDFYLGLNKEQREAFAALAGTSEKYIAVKLVRAAAVPRPAQMERLWDACCEFNAPFSRADLLHFFYPETCKSDLEAGISRSAGATT